MKTVQPIRIAACTLNKGWARAVGSLFVWALTVGSSSCTLVCVQNTPILVLSSRGPGSGIMLAAAGEARPVESCWQLEVHRSPCSRSLVVMTWCVARLYKRRRTMANYYPLAALHIARLLASLLKRGRFNWGWCYRLPLHGLLMRGFHASLVAVPGVDEQGWWALNKTWVIATSKGLVPAEFHSNELHYNGTK
eukprot:1157573-Pelagomonas_calceolata.AAC.3